MGVHPCQIFGGEPYIMTSQECQTQIFCRTGGGSNLKFSYLLEQRFQILGGQKFFNLPLNAYIVYIRVKYI